VCDVRELGFAFDGKLQHEVRFVASTRTPALQAAEQSVYLDVACQCGCGERLLRVSVSPLNGKAFAMRHRGHALLSGLCLTAFATFGCVVSEIPSTDPAAGLPVDPATGRPVDPNTGEVLAPFSPAPIAMRRLTTAQYRNVVRDLVGPVQLTTELETDTAVNGFIEIGAARTTISPAAVEKFEAAAFEVGKYAASSAVRGALVGCAPTTAIDTACTRAFLERFGRRAFRRPLTTEELNRWVGIAENSARTLNSFWAGIEFAVAGLFQSPNLLFRVEIGEPDPAQAARYRYTNFEMATRLSFLLWNTAPDDTLLDAAAAGKLTTTEGLFEQAKRLLGDARARVAMNNFQSERLGLEGLDNLGKDRSVFPAFTPALVEGMREDILRTIDHVAFEQNGDVRDLLETRVSFVNGELATLYGVPRPASGTQLAMIPDTSPRVGLLAKAGLLALNAHTRETSPTLRGKFARERLLCQGIPAPPPDVVTIVPPPNPNAPTMRERLASHRNSPSCMGCHYMMDPLGLPFENFDAIGAYRATDNGHALDLSGELDGQTYTGPAALGTLLKNDRRVIECSVRQLYRYATGHVELEGEKVLIKSMTQRFGTAGYRMPELLKVIIVSDGFRYLNKGAP
jgi:hypothetical protein